jgi:hypothetical protein
MGIIFDCDQGVYKATQKSSLSNKNQNMKESSLVVTSVTSKHRTRRLLGFINNQNTGISNLNVNNVSTKQQKRSSKGAHSIETRGGTFDCDKCEYKATIKINLRVHTLSKCEDPSQSKHEGIKFDPLMLR